MKKKLIIGIAVLSVFLNPVTAFEIAPEQEAFILVW